MQQQKTFNTFLMILFLLTASFICKNEIDSTSKNSNSQILKGKKIENNFSKLEFDTVVEMFNQVYAEMPILKKDSEKYMQCDWLENYNKKLSKKLITKYGSKKNLFRIVGIIKMTEKEYVVFYKNQCRLLNENKVSESIKNRFNEIHACSLPNEKNKIQPTGFKNHYGKLFSYKGGIKTLIQVWHKG